MIDEPTLQALFTPADQRSAEQAARVALDDALIAQVQAADVVVIGAPTYNFGITAQLKSWFDAIARAGVTFKYGPTGPVGLLTGKKSTSPCRAAACTATARPTPSWRTSRCS